MAKRAVLDLLLASYGISQVQDQSASGLIGFLNRKPDLADRMGLLPTCPDDNDRRAASALAALGDAAIPEIDAALDSIEKSGRQSLHSDWLLYAYAKIRGPAAYPRLALLGSAPDRSIALALGLTSYVSVTHALPGVRMVDGRIFLCRAQEPRDALDQLILALETNDRRSFETSLGPKAMAALNLLLEGKTWEDLRASGGAMGYRFEVPGGVNPEIDTLLTNRFGGACGRTRIKFVSVGNGRDGRLMYRVDNSDLRTLLGSIAACAMAR